MARRTTLAACALALGLGGCIWPKSSDDTSGGSGAVAWSSPMLEITTGQNVHYGPGVPSGSASLVNQRDAAGQLDGGSFRLVGSVDGASCSLSFDAFGAGTGIRMGAYTVESVVDGSTPDGIVYPTGGESVSTPAGAASCNGSDCDGTSFVIEGLDATHVYGYFMGGGAAAPITCTFWMPLTAYSP